MAINIIVAMDRQRVIGKKNMLPWHMPADLQHFKQLTLGNTVIVGRKTHESIIARLGRPLPGRKTIVVTRQNLEPSDNLAVAGSLPDALALAKDKEVFIIGGAQIYEQALSLADRIYLTRIETEVEGGDTFFPEIDKAQWQQMAIAEYQPEGSNPYAYAFVTFERR